MRKLLYIVAGIALIACGGENDQPKEIKSEVEDSYQEEERIISKRTLKELKNASKVVYTLPSPVEMADILHDTKAEYDVAILNDPNAIDNYVTDFKRAMNLGVYFGDLSFTSMFDYPQDAMKFMGAAQAMSDELNIQGVFTDDVIMRLEENMSNKDSLMDIVASTYMDTDLYLQDNERPIIAKAILAGAWLEGLYIAVNLKTEEGIESEIWKKIGEQKPALGNLSHMIKDCNDRQFDSLIVKLDALVATFDEVNLDYSKTDAKTNEAAKTTTLGSSLKVSIDQELFERIKEQTTSLRNSITE